MQNDVSLRLPKSEQSAGESRRRLVNWLSRSATEIAPFLGSEEDEERMDAALEVVVWGEAFVWFTLLVV